MGAKKALLNFSRRASGVKKQRQKKAKNERPEKQVEKEVLAWCEDAGFDVSVVESKAVFSRAAGRYLRGQASPGFSDLAGITPDGTGCFIELKAKGRINTIRRSQVDFLLRKIRKGAFAVCVDDAVSLGNIYRSWIELIKQSDEEAKKYLIMILPKAHLADDDSDNELSW